MGFLDRLSESGKISSTDLTRLKKQANIKEEEKVKQPEGRSYGSLINTASVTDTKSLY